MTVEQLPDVQYCTYPLETLPETEKTTPADTGGKAIGTQSQELKDSKSLISRAKCSCNISSICIESTASPDQLPVATEGMVGEVSELKDVDVEILHS